MSTRWILNPVKFPTNPYLQSMQKETNSECLRMNVSPFLLNCCLFSSSSRSLLPMYAYIYICLYLYNDPQNQTFQWTKNDNFNPICSMYGIYIYIYISTNTQRMTQLYIRFCLKTGYPITSTGYIIKKWPCAWENLPFPSNLNYPMIVGYIYSIVSSPLSHFITT